MATQGAPRGFSFSFSDLAVAGEAPGLCVVEAEAAPAAPGGLRVLDPAPRPRWLPRLLPVFRASDPLRVGIRSAAAPAFAARVGESLAALFAMAGAAAGIRVGAWEGGFAVSGHGLDRVAAEPHAQLVAAELEPVSIGLAAGALDEVPPSARWLVLHGDVRSIDSVVGIEPALARLPADRVVRLPLFEREDLAAAARGLPPGLGRRRIGRAYLELAAGLARAYQAAQP